MTNKSQPYKGQLANMKGKWAEYFCAAHALKKGYEAAMTTGGHVDLHLTDVNKTVYNVQVKTLKRGGKHYDNDGIALEHERPFTNIELYFRNNQKEKIYYVDRGIDFLVGIHPVTEEQHWYSKDQLLAAGGSTSFNVTVVPAAGLPDAGRMQRIKQAMEIPATLEPFGI